MRRYRGTFDIFFGVEHRIKKEAMEVQFNKEAKQGWRFAADAARITDENASSEDSQSTATWEQLLAKTKLSQSRETMGELPKHG